MLGSSVLETAIGLVFVYLVFALIASGITEYFAAYLDRRRNYLKHVFFNLFDNDDPRGRALLNLFVGHPLIQALNSTDWAPQFRSAVDRIGAAQDQFGLARVKWQAASEVVSAAGAALDAAQAADAAAVRAATAANAVQTALKTSVSAPLAANDVLESAIREADAACAAALVAADNADQAAQAAKVAQLAVERAKTAKPDRRAAAGSQSASTEPAGLVSWSGPAGQRQAPLAPPAAAVPAPTPPANTSPEARAKAAADCATSAAARAKKAAAGAGRRLPWPRKPSEGSTPS